MQKPEHIEQYLALINAVMARPEGRRDSHYWEGARDMLAWVLEEPAEYFDPRIVRRIAELSMEGHE